jgi:hypothetical protein
MRLAALGSLLAAAAIPQTPAQAGPTVSTNGSAPAATYADVADLADSARIVLRAEVRKVAVVEPERAPGVRPGWARLYVEGRTQALIRADTPLGQSLRYLVDVPLDSRGKPPALKKKVVLLFADSASGAAGDLTLTAPDAQLLWSPAAEQEVRDIVSALVAPDAPPRITGVREAIHVPGNLAGEGETQFFLQTASQSAAAITVQHKPGTPVAWGVSFSEVAAATGDPPKPDTLTWYRLACFLPKALPAGVNLSDGPGPRAQAEADYGKVLADLGPCERTRGQ